MNNLGRLVKWQDDNGGWHTGRVVLYWDGKELRCCSAACHELKLIKESCSGVLSWVNGNYLQDWPTRDQWEDVTKPYATADFKSYYNPSWDELGKQQRPKDY